MRLMRYSGLITKTRAMSGKLLEHSQYRELTELATVSEAVGYLKGTAGYQEIYREHEGVWHRGQVEAVIRNSLYRDFEKLYRFSNKEQRLAFAYFFFRYEADLLKKQVKHLFRGQMQELEKYSDAFFSKHTSFPLESVLKAQSLQELLLCLTGSGYEPLFAKLHHSGTAQYVDYAMGLDLFYYDTVFRSIRAMKSSMMKSVLQEIYGTRIDWLNIMWIYRWKRYYDQTPEEILAKLIPHHGRLRPQELQEMARAADLAEQNRILAGTVYFRGKDAYVQMEDEISYRNVIEQMYHHVSRKYPVSMAPVLRYIHEKELEIGRLTTIIEGIRYQVAPKDIKDFILITV